MNGLFHAISCLEIDCEYCDFLCYEGLIEACDYCGRPGHTDESNWTGVFEEPTVCILLCNRCAEQMTKDCENCKGIGWIGRNMDCSRCHGGGKEWR